MFLAPKVYGGVTETGFEITKVKGLKNKVAFKDLKSLLVKDNTLELNQEKWFKNLEDSSITIKQQIYTLAVTDNKRELIYENDVLVLTKTLITNCINN